MRNATFFIGFRNSSLNKKNCNKFIEVAPFIDPIGKPGLRSRNRSRSGGGAGGAPIFSPSPMDPSPVSLRGGFMGLTVPSSHMNDIYEEGLLDTIEAGLGASRQQTSSERTPLLGGKNSDKR